MPQRGLRFGMLSARCVTPLRLPALGFVLSAACVGAVLAAAWMRSEKEKRQGTCWKRPFCFGFRAPVLMCFGGECAERSAVPAHFTVSSLSVLSLWVTMIFSPGRGLDQDSEGHPACSPAPGQDQRYLSTGQAAMKAMQVPQSVLVLCYPYHRTSQKQSVSSPLN